MLAVATKEGLLSAAQWNVVEIHTLNTSTKSFEYPDRIIFDLDLGEGAARVKLVVASFMQPTAVFLRGPNAP